MITSYVTSFRSRIGSECIFVPGVRAIILNEQGEVLLQRRSDNNFWGLPGGGVELYETALEALRREVREETRIIVRGAEPMALYSGPGQRFCYPNGDEVQPFAIAFIVRKWAGHPEADGNEGLELRFWSLDALPCDIVPTHARTLEDFRTYNGRFIVADNQKEGECTLHVIKRSE
jgi:ADP-ribose pyrophosphatase YjhB (NUDIX family)